MLLIRQAQYDVIAESYCNARLLLHIRKFFPKPCEEFGADKLQDEIAKQVERAKYYGFEEAQDIFKFVDIAFAVGYEFDSDPSVQWAADILNDPSQDNPSVRARRLHLRAVRHLSELSEIQPGEIEDDFDEDLPDVFEDENINENKPDIEDE